MPDLISIIEEAESQFDNKFDVGGFNNLLERASPKEFKDFNRETLLKLVEGLEKWAEENEYCSKCCSPKKYCPDFGKFPSALDTKDLLSLLQPLKDNLKK